MPRAGIIGVSRDTEHDDLLEYGGAAVVKEEGLKIHPVKHIKKTDEEFLDKLI